MPRTPILSRTPCRPPSTQVSLLPPSLLCSRQLLSPNAHRPRPMLPLSSQRPGHPSPRYEKQDSVAAERAGPVSAPCPRGAPAEGAGPSLPHAQDLIFSPHVPGLRSNLGPGPYVGLRLVSCGLLTHHPTVTQGPPASLGQMPLGALPSTESVGGTQKGSLYAFPSYHRWAGPCGSERADEPLQSSDFKKTPWTPVCGMVWWV